MGRYAPELELLIHKARRVARDACAPPLGWIADWADALRTGSPAGAKAASAAELSLAQRKPRRLSSSTSSAVAGVTKSGPVGISSPPGGNNRCRARSASITTGRYPWR